MLELGELGAGAGTFTRRATTTPPHPSLGQGPRQVARPVGAVVSTTCWQRGQAPLTLSGGTVRLPFRDLYRAYLDGKRLPD